MATLVHLRHGATHDVVACCFGVDRSAERADVGDDIDPQDVDARAANVRTGRGRGPGWRACGAGGASLPARYGQVDAQRSTSKSDDCEAPYIPAVDPVAQDATPTTSRWSTRARTGLDHHDGTESIHPRTSHSGQVR
ncbi:hypothetical protein ACFVVB_20015 [Streptomyces californicus]|uniref:hypothetical protein n=1 Tax=Streptomyces californicus TaxID=67351 RepID=UPI0036DCD84E